MNLCHIKIERAQPKSFESVNIGSMTLKTVSVCIVKY